MVNHAQGAESVEGMNGFCFHIFCVVVENSEDKFIFSWTELCNKVVVARYFGLKLKEKGDLQEYFSEKAVNIL